MKQQSGFSVLEVIMVVVIVGLIGAVGWLFWDKITSKPAEQKATASTSKSPSPSPKISTQTYEAKSIGLTFNYPSTWKLTDADDYPYRTNGPNDVHKKIQAPSGFNLVFSTVSTTGRGGTGPCLKVTGFKTFGESQLPGVYAAMMDDNDGKGVIVVLSRSKTEQDHNENCLYRDLVRLTEPEYAGESTDYTTKPYGFSFGTFLSYENREAGEFIEKPSEAELNEAAAILTSLRKS